MLATVRLQVSRHQQLLSFGRAPQVDAHSQQMDRQQARAQFSTHPAADTSSARSREPLRRLPSNRAGSSGGEAGTCSTESPPRQAPRSVIDLTSPSIDSADEQDEPANRAATGRAGGNTGGGGHRLADSEEGEDEAEQMSIDGSVGSSPVQPRPGSKRYHGVIASSAEHSSSRHVRSRVSGGPPPWGGPGARGQIGRAAREHSSLEPLSQSHSRTGNAPASRSSPPEGDGRVSGPCIEQASAAGTASIQLRELAGASPQASQPIGERGSGDAEVSLEDAMMDAQGSAAHGRLDGEDHVEDDVEADSDSEAEFIQEPSDLPPRRVGVSAAGSGAGSGSRAGAGSGSGPGAGSGAGSGSGSVSGAGAGAGSSVVPALEPPAQQRVIQLPQVRPAGYQPPSDPQVRQYVRDRVAANHDRPHDPSRQQLAALERWVVLGSKETCRLNDAQQFAQLRGTLGTGAWEMKHRHSQLICVKQRIAIALRSRLPGAREAAKELARCQLLSMFQCLGSIHTRSGFRLRHEPMATYTGRCSLAHITNLAIQCLTAGNPEACLGLVSPFP